ncbi:MAG: hypothetical protein A2Z14_09705 [Chloroflexi bacterium RBG_16_48_8]|nr:MAG: hypothetical protein A2Z14_09705 [Chloroflexi bacterium RBG_16_48_8]
MKNHYQVICLIILLPVLFSCNVLSQILPTSKSMEETPSPSVTIPAIPPTATIRPSLPCPIPAGNSGLFHSSSVEELPAEILQYLNAGGNLVSLLSSLEESGTVPIDSPGLVEKDFTGDGFYDIALTLIDPEPEFILTQGTLILNQCQGDHYEMAFQSPELMDWGVPTLFSSDDLNGDSISDLLVGRQSCGAHTCFIRLEALIWNGETLENRLQGTSDDMPGPTIEVYSDTNEILVTAEGIGSVGAGPFRRFIRRWTWDTEAGAFLSSPDTFLPSNYRIHVLHDADQAAQDRNYDRAIELYTLVIEDDELLDYIDPPTERAQLGAYASFRLMLVYLLLEEFEAAEAAHASIMATYPADNPASDFAQMADAFWTEYQSSSDLGSACLAAQTYAISHQETIIDKLYYGYANPSYEAADICPFSE